MKFMFPEEEYIDMDVSSATLSVPSSPPSPQSRDFEFQMSGKPLPEMDGITSPADELFHNGKLLPLHLHKLLQQDSTPTHNANANANADAAATPYQSCNASPATSCYVSGELDPESYFTDECQADEEPAPQQLRTGNKSWAKKLKLIKKASRAYLKSLFTRSGCSDESCSVPKATECSSGRQDEKKAVRRVDAERMVVEGGRGHRRSFSGAIKRRTSNKSSSTSFSTSSSSSSNSSSFSSVNSNSNNGAQMLKRSSSGNSEVECSIQGAIAYCKKSQQEDQVRTRKSATDVEFYAALSASRIAADCEKKKQERPEICRG